MLVDDALMVVLSTSIDDDDDDALLFIAHSLFFAAHDFVPRDDFLFFFSSDFHIKTLNSTKKFLRSIKEEEALCDIEQPTRAFFL